MRFDGKPRGRFHANPNDNMVKQAIEEASARKKQNVIVSQEWFDTVRSVLVALGGNPSKNTASLNRFNVRFGVDPALKGNDFRVE